MYIQDIICFQALPYGREPPWPKGLRERPFVLSVVFHRQLPAAHGDAFHVPKRCTDRLFKLVICEAEVAGPFGQSWRKRAKDVDRMRQFFASGRCTVSCVPWLLPFPCFARHSIRIFYLSSWEMKAKSSSTRSTKWMQWQGISVASPDGKSWAIRWNEVSRILVNITRCLWKFIPFFLTEFFFF